MNIYIPEWIAYAIFYVCLIALLMVLVDTMRHGFFAFLCALRLGWLVVMALTFRKYGPKWNDVQFLMMAKKVKEENPEKHKHFADLWERADW